MAFQNRIAVLLRLDDLIRRKATGTLSELIPKFGVSRSTVLRYINELRMNYDAPIAFDRERKTFYYTEPYDLATWLLNGRKRK
jgi:predicted DNA-binding transcriptional regulator YafY